MTEKVEIYWVAQLLEVQGVRKRWVTTRIHHDDRAEAEDAVTQERWPGEKWRIIRRRTQV